MNTATAFVSLGHFGPPPEPIWFVPDVEVVLE